MISFALNLILMAALGAILYLVARTLPRISETPEGNGRNGKMKLLERWVVSEIPEKVDEWLSDFLIKTLRKLKVVLMKVDNNLTSHLRRIKPQNGKSETNGRDFKEIVEEQE